MKNVSSFPDHSWDRFFMDFGAILAPSWEPTWSKNPSKIYPKSDLENFQLFSLIFLRILLDLAPPRTSKVGLPSRREANFWDFGFHLLYRCFMEFRLHFWMDFGTIFDPKSLQHGLKNIKKKTQILDNIFIDFCSILASILGPIFLQNRLKRGGRVKHHQYFYHLRFLSPLWGTPWLRFPPFWVQFGRILEQFWMDFLYF